MFNRKWIAIIALSLFLVGVSTITIIWACGSSPRPACAQTAWLAKIVTSVVVVPPAATSADVDITLIPNVAWTVFPTCPAPVLAEIVLTVTVPGLAPQMFTVPAPTPTVPGVQPAIPTTLTVALPPGVPTIGAVVGEYRVSFAGGISGAGLVIGLGDTEVCFVEPSPVDESIPRLDMSMFTPVDTPFQSCQRGDVTHNWYVISNNDPDHSVRLDVTASANQIARRPGGDAPGIYNVSSDIPGTDNFPLSFGADPLPVGDPMDPDDPINHPIVTPEPFILEPFEVVIIKVNVGTFGMCADGSCSELLTKASGEWLLPDDATSPALACAGSAIFVDNMAPGKLPLCDIIDSVKSGPAQQCAWETAFFGDDPHHTTLPGRDNPNVVMDNFISDGILSSLTAPPNPLSSLPQQAQDIIRLPEGPHSVSYVMDCSRLEEPFQQIRNFVTIHGLDHLPVAQPFDVPFFFLTNGNSTFNWNFEITIPEDLGREGATVVFSAGENEVFSGGYDVFCEDPPDPVGCSFDTCRTFTKFVPPFGGGLVLAAKPSDSVVLLPSTAQDPTLEIVDSLTDSSLAWSAASTGPLFTPVPSSTLVPGTPLGVLIDKNNLPLAPGLAVEKIVVENGATYNGVTTILVVGRTLPEPPDPVVDSDGDGVSDDLDNAVCVANPDQRDTNGDMIGNVIDPDLDNDGVVGISDFNLFRSAFGTETDLPNFNADADFDGDGSVSIADFNVMRALFNQPVDRFALCPE